MNSRGLLWANVRMFSRVSWSIYISGSPLVPRTSGCFLSASASRSLGRLPCLDLIQSEPGVPRFFLNEPLEVIPHRQAELGIDLIVPLLEPGEKFDEAGEQWDEAGVVAAAEAFLDVDVDRR